MPTALTPAQLVADILALHKMLAAPGLDPATVADLKGRVVDHWEALGNKVTTGYDHAFWGDRWWAHFGDMDCDCDADGYYPTVTIGYGATEDEALERLLELTGEEVA